MVAVIKLKKKKKICKKMTPIFTPRSALAPPSLPRSPLRLFQTSKARKAPFFQLCWLSPHFRHVTPSWEVELWLEAARSPSAAAVP